MKKATTKNPLPAGITARDLTRVPFSAYEKETKDVPFEDRTFELWHVQRFGWVIPTLLIGRASRRAAAQTTDRTYAVTMNGNIVRVGKGPHVTECVTVHVRASRLTQLQKFIDLRRKGAADAGQVRDRISSRRAQGQLMRAEGRSSWRWDV